MTRIVIREENPSQENGTFTAVVQINHQEYTGITITTPFTPKEGQELAWYFEEHINYPYLEKVRFKKAGESIQRYGEALFQQVFAHPGLDGVYDELKSAIHQPVQIEIKGSAAFHALHWEAMKDPDDTQYLTLQWPVVRVNTTPCKAAVQVNPSTTLNILVVTARPLGIQDVAYRTITRPLVELTQKTQLKVNIDIVRPGTFEAFKRQLESKRGVYHVAHFDMHGCVMTYEEYGQSVHAVDKSRNEALQSVITYRYRYGRGEIQPYEGFKAFLAFEPADRDAMEQGIPDYTEASEIAALLTGCQVPVVVMNACQSAKHVDDQKEESPTPNTSESSLAACLVREGVQMAVGMQYAITVDAAKRMMQAFYQHLPEGKPVNEALLSARREMYNHKERKAAYNQNVLLEDCILPVVVQNREVQFEFEDMTFEEMEAWYQKKANTFSYTQPKCGFFGRDVDILQIEKKLLLGRNILLITGMGGCGKTTLLKHLAHWWQTTHGVEQVFYFGYDSGSWTRHRILHELANQILPKEMLGRFNVCNEDVQQEMIVEVLRSHKCLLILDNLESVRAEKQAVGNRLEEEEQEKLRGFIAKLYEGKTWVLLGSRRKEEWLR